MEKIANGLYRLTFGQPEAFTPVSVLKPEPRFDALNDLTDGDLPFSEEDIRSRERAGGFLLEIPLSPEEDLYGLGLMLKSFRQRSHGYIRIHICSAAVFKLKGNIEIISGTYAYTRVFRRK